MSYPGYQGMPHPPPRPGAPYGPAAPYAPDTPAAQRPLPSPGTPGSGPHDSSYGQPRYPVQALPQQAPPQSVTRAPGMLARLGGGGMMVLGLVLVGGVVLLLPDRCIGHPRDRMLALPYAHSFRRLGNPFLLGSGDSASSLAGLTSRLRGEGSAGQEHRVSHADEARDRQCVIQLAQFPFVRLPRLGCRTSGCASTCPCRSRRDLVLGGGSGVRFAPCRSGAHWWSSTWLVSGLDSGAHLGGCGRQSGHFEDRLPPGLCSRSSRSATPRRVSLETPELGRECASHLPLRRLHHQSQ